MPNHPERVPPKETRFDRRPTLLNFITAEDYITCLDDPAVSFERKQRIVEEIAACEGMIKRAQQAELHRVLTMFDSRVKGNKDLKKQVQEALQKVDQVRFVD